MPTPWFKNVRDSHQLSIFPTKSVADGPWNAIFAAAVDAFNKMSGAMQLGVTFVKTDKPPDPTNMNSGANVQFQAADGEVRETVLKTKFGDVISEFKETFSGSAMHGLTVPATWADDKGARNQFRAYIYVPVEPLIFAGGAGKLKRRPVGDGVRLFIAVHEMIHACGLSNEEHSPGAAADVFLGQPQPLEGATAKDDKLNISLSPITNLPANPPAPPFFLSGRTAGLIRANWS